LASFERLSALDASFLYWDTPETPMNMGNVCIFEGEPFFDEHGEFRLGEVHAAIASRLPAVPRYRMRVAPGARFVSHPVMVDDPDFDIANHVKLVALARPGSDKLLKEMFSRIHEGTLDRSRPLWEIWFIEGLEGGRVGMVQKIHHAPFDGQSTVDILETLLDSEPNPVPTSAAAPDKPRPGPGVIEVLAADLRAHIGKAWDLTVAGPNAPLLKPLRLLANLNGLLTVAGLRLAPRSELNGRNTRARRLDWVSTDLQRVKEIRPLVAGATLNDVMLTCVARGIRELLASRDVDVNASQIRVFIPVSLRSDNDRGALGGNRLSAVMAPLHLNIADDLERLKAIHHTTSTMKDGGQPLGFSLLAELLDFVPPALLALIGPTFINLRHYMNLTVTNVTGPRQELYLLGAKMLELNPMVPIGNQLTLNIAIESYAGKLSVGLSADGSRIPDLEPVKTGITDAAASLHNQALKESGDNKAPRVPDTTIDHPGRPPSVGYA
jgi:WS/DGAT/MGAT family acyltransferase